MADKSHHIVQGSYFEVNVGFNVESPLFVDDSIRQSSIASRNMLGISCCEVCRNPLMDTSSHVCLITNAHIYKYKKLLMPRRERIEVSSVLKLTRLEVLLSPKASRQSDSSHMKSNRRASKILYDIDLACTKVFSILGDEPDYPVSLYSAGESQPLVSLNLESASQQSILTETIQRAINFATRNAAREAMISKDLNRLLFVFHHSRDELELILPPQNSIDPLSHIAVDSGNFEALASMLSVCPDLLFLFDQNQLTPLHKACQKGNLELLRLMFDESYRLEVPIVSVANIRGHQGRSLLHDASSREIMEFLLSVGCDIDGRDEVGKTALCLAAENRNFYLVESLIDLGSGVGFTCWQYGYNACMWAAKNGSSDILQFIIDRDLTIASSVSLSGFSPLHLSARFGHLDCVTMLLKVGVDCNAQDKNGRTALSHACEFEMETNPVEYMDMLGSLLVLSSCSLRDHDGKQPLHYAAKSGNSAAISLIIQSGGEVNAIDLEGSTPLEICENKLIQFEKMDHYEEKMMLICRFTSAKDTLLSFGAVKRLHHQVPVESDDCEMLFTKIKDQTYVVSAATPVRMISRLTTFPFFSQTDCKIFLASFREFMTPIDLINTLRGRNEIVRLMLCSDSSSRPEADLGNPSNLTSSVWDETSSNATSARPEEERKTEYADSSDSKRSTQLLRADLVAIMQFVSCWKEMHWNEYISNNTVLSNEFRRFSTELKTLWPDIAPEIDLRLPETAHDWNSNPISISASPSCSMQSDESIVQALLRTDDVEFSKQLTFFEFAFFQRIKGKELLNLSFQANPDLLAPNYVKLRDFHQSMISMVVGTVLLSEEAEERARIISKFISIASSCRTVMRNINGVVEIVNALSSTAIFRLKQTWKLIPKKHLQKLQELKTLIHSDNNYAYMRIVLRDTELPCMPYLGLFLKDIVSIEQIPSKIAIMNAFGEKTDKTMVNFSKMTSLGRVLLEFMRFQSVPFNLTASEAWKKWIYTSHLHPYADTEAKYERSVELEPLL